MCCGCAVILSQLLLVLPWVWSYSDFESLITNIFPIHRGLYQLKVASFWCITEPIFKYQLKYSQDFLVKLTTILTLTTSIPALVQLLRQPKNFKIALFLVSLNFFFFSYHVHEKTIMFPLAIMAINIKYFYTIIRHFGIYYLDFTVFAMITILKLMQEDKLLF